MENYCVVCTNSIEWIAYGSCGHGHICSMCSVRLRFVFSDCRCCICKTESSFVFVTMAFKSFTEAKINFSEFPLGVTEGQHGKYWYHEDSQTFFDDVNHYKMIRSMCELSCSICNNNTEVAKRGNNNRRPRFKNIENLKKHLHYQHRKKTCNLCIEGRKMFISEQKLYTRPQLWKHTLTGDSEVDGNESERGGFTGHPSCRFCIGFYYGVTELYMHMSSKHLTCYICQRQYPDQYDYYFDYEDLERHIVIEHGGHMRNAVFLNAEHEEESQPDEITISLESEPVSSRSIAANSDSSESTT